MWLQSTRGGPYAILAVAAALAASACATQPARSLLECAADEQLAMRVGLVLARDPRIFARHIDVDASRGVVRLSGFVWSTEDFYEARRVTAAVPGVTAVKSQLELMVGGRSGAR